MLLRHPEVLWLLIPIAALILVVALRGRRVAVPAAFVRIAAVGCILTAIAGPAGAYGTSGTNVIFVVDRSGSIPPTATPTQAKLINDTLDHLSSGTRAGVVAFAGQASVIFPPGGMPRDPNRIAGALTEATNIDRDHTNVASGLRLARAMLAQGGGGQIFLLSDGQENSGDARAEAESAASEGIRISPLKSDVLLFPNDVRVALVDVPQTVWGGDVVPVRVAATGNTPWKGQVRLSVDGKPVLDAPVDARDGNGSAVTTLNGIDPGTHVVTASVQVTDGENRIPENDSLSIVTTVREKPNIWLIEGTPGEGKPIADSLIQNGMNVTSKSPKDIPPKLSTIDADAFVLVDVSAKDLSLDQMTTIQQSVRANGRGLVVVGGANAYGAGSYYNTPLEEALPVKMGYAPGNQRDQVALGIIIDHSGSMDFGEGSKDTKISLARQSAILAVNALKVGDEFGLVVFNDGADTIVPLTPVSDNRMPITQAINGIRAEGGTDIYAGMARMLDVMRGSTASVKHIILMSDGESQGRSDYITLIDQMKQLGITVTCIAIGSDADQKTMKVISDAGGGQFYYAASANQIPNITLNDAQSAGKQTTRMGQFKAAVLKPSPVIGDINPSELPDLDGYQVTEPKPNADVILASGQKDPVLAQWQYGLGRVVAWTPDAGTAFAKRWPAWNKYGQFWHQALLWALPDPGNASLAVDVRADGDQEVIGVDATDIDGHYVNNAPITGTLVTPDGKSFNIRLPQVGPGRYEVRVRAAAPGAYRLSLDQARPGTATVTKDSGFAVPYSPEYIPTAGGSALLGDVANLTGSSVLDSGAMASDTSGTASTITRYREYWPPFAIAGLALFLLDLALRLSLAPADRAAGGRLRRALARWRTRRKRTVSRRPPSQPPPSLR